MYKIENKNVYLKWIKFHKPFLVFCKLHFFNYKKISVRRQLKATQMNKKQVLRAARRS